MSSKLIQYLSKYINISNKLSNALIDNLLIRELPKGTILLKEGDFCNECYFILHGLIRSYYLKDNEEVTTDFYMEEQAASPTCYGKNYPSSHFLETLENSVVVVGSPVIENDMYKDFPELETLSRIIGEKIMSRYKDSYDSFKMSSPEERYLEFVKNNPGLVQRVPQYQIASYLGMKPESLSRIRNRISKK